MPSHSIFNISLFANHKYLYERHAVESVTFFNIVVIVVGLLLCLVGSCSFPDVVEKVFSCCGIGCTGHVGTVRVLVVVMVAVMMRICILFGVDSDHEAIVRRGVSDGNTLLLLVS